MTTLLVGATIAMGLKTSVELLMKTMHNPMIPQHPGLSS